MHSTSACIFLTFRISRGVTGCGAGLATTKMLPVLIWDHAFPQVPNCGLAVPCTDRGCHPRKFGVGARAHGERGTLCPFRRPWYRSSTLLCFYQTHVDSPLHPLLIFADQMCRFVAALCTWLFSLAANATRRFSAVWRKTVWQNSSIHVQDYGAS